MLVINDLVKTYGKFRAVDNLSLEIGKGEIYGFVGANGAGKTTTMKIIAGLLKPTSGSVVVAGIDILKYPASYKNKIGYMPDFFGVYDDLKVTEYLDFYSGVYGIEKSQRPKLIDELLELVNLTDKKDFYVDDLSRGMKQRLCLARSLIHNPELLILDEPASGLDPKARVEMKEVLKELKDLGKTIIISSHILPELAELCTSIGIIEKGKMVVSGTVEEIMQKAAQKKMIRMKVLGDMEGAVKLLKEQPSIGSIEVHNDYLEADFDGTNEVMAEILKTAIKNDIPVVSFTEVDRNLESVFMHLIGGKEDEN
ncbi:ABC transporter ATP-binding protein [Acetivibrio clariflavus]|uniref:ABC-type multidrug transport system, ATPase component n=1 Tax=Acetivibrio clariflavus (strain DSM 19732 / NBRC 101661 / EBR45) TaxID=720554 RepID=G8LSA8_ACECE|nr:ABC transporter ATP-binding protein [Acetivibrio clariflavus]AEV67169.1 ABC-type multidrug transport system, ATPase component [Acetivibrio clariflavus DSM 19732]HOQ01576.1 ABC transporter ATP-binding protein [Acetivibrio clariflavus]